LSEEKILVLGGSGFVGRHLRTRLVAQMGEDRVVSTYNGTPFPGGLKFDARAGGIAQAVPGLETFSHAVILLANTSPDDCALHEEESRALNVTAITEIIDQLAESGVRPVFASTEVVFDGQKGRYEESDPVNPILLYGKQKAEIEARLAERTTDALILRIANVYGSDPTGGGVMAGWFRTIRDGAETVRCARDYTASPVHVDDVAEAVIRLMEEGCQGIYHVAGPRPLSRLEMLETLLEEMRRSAPVTVRVESCSIDDFPTEEKRPRDVSMVSDKLEAATGLKMGTLDFACCDLVAAAS